MTIQNRPPIPAHDNPDLPELAATARSRTEHGIVFDLHPEGHCEIIAGTHRRQAIADTTGTDPIRALVARILPARH